MKQILALILLVSILPFKAFSACGTFLDPILTKEEILELLPHGHPVDWVDRVISIDKAEEGELTPGDKIVAEWDIHLGLPFFVGHYPNNPITPGNFTSESIEQAAAILAMYDIGATDLVPVLAGSDGTRFLNAIIPPSDGSIQRVKLEVTYKGIEGGLHVFKGVARGKDNKLAVIIKKILATMADPSQFDSNQ